jgi:hypothetical protein
VAEYANATNEEERGTKLRRRSRNEVSTKLWITRRVNVEIGEITFLTNGIWPRF